VRAPQFSKGLAITIQHVRTFAQLHLTKKRESFLDRTFMSRQYVQIRTIRVRPNNG